MMPKVKVCVKCDLHGQSVPYAGHGACCPYKQCMCRGCQDHDKVLAILRQERSRRKTKERNVEIRTGNLRETMREGREGRAELSGRDTLYLNSDTDDTDSLYDGKGIENKNRIDLDILKTQIKIEVNPDIYLPEEVPECVLLSNTTPPRNNSHQEITTPSTLPWSPSPSSPQHPPSPTSSRPPGKGPGYPVSSDDEPPDPEDFDDTLHGLKYQQYKGNHHLSFSSDSDMEKEPDIFRHRSSPTLSRLPGQVSGDETCSKADAEQEDHEDFDDYWHGLKYKRYRGDIPLSLGWDSEDDMEIREEGEEVSVSDLLESSVDIDEYYENLEKLQKEHEFKENEDARSQVKTSGASVGVKKLKQEEVRRGCTELHADDKVYSDILANESIRNVDAISNEKVIDKALKTETTVDEDASDSVVACEKKLSPVKVKTGREKLTVEQRVKLIEEPVKNTKSRHTGVVESDHANMLPDRFNVHQPGSVHASPHIVSPDYQEVQIPIPHHLRGLVIGRHGHFIRRIISVTGTFIFFHPVTVFCTIQGHSRGVETAIRMIHERLGVRGLNFSRDSYYP